MKKRLIAFLSVVLSVAMIIPAFAASIDFVTRGTVDGTEYVFMFGHYSGDEKPSEVGISVGEKNMPLTPWELANADKTKRFGIGISDPQNILGDSFTAIPYVKVKGERTDGEAVNVLKTEVKSPDPTVAKTAEDIVTDDITNQTTLPDGTANVNVSNFAIRCDGLKGPGTTSHFAVALIQFDLTKLSDADADRDFKFIFSGRITDWGMDPEIKEIKLSAYAVSEIEWSESNYPTQNEKSFYNQFVNNKPELGYVKIPTSARTNASYSLSLSSFIGEKLKAKETKATIALAIDNSQAAALSAVTGTRNAILFNFNTSESESAPTVRYYAKDISFSDPALNALNLNGRLISGFDKNTLDYTYYLPYGETSMPEITASANSYASVAVTQATAETRTATVTVTAGSGDKKTYIVEFVNAAYPSAESSLSLRWGGVMAKAYSADAQTSAIHSFDLSAPNNSTMYTDAFAMNGTRAGYEPVVAYVKLDLSKLTDIDPSKPVTLNLNYTLSAFDANSTGTTSADISLYSANEFNWTNVSLSSVKGTAAVSAAINGKTPIATQNLSVGQGKIGDIDITSFAQQAIADGNTEQTVAVYVNPIPFGDSNNRLSLRFFHETGSQSGLTYYKYNKDPEYANASLTELKADGNTVTGFNANTLNYMCYIPYGETSMPEITASANSYASVAVTQATAETRTATVTVTAGSGDKKTYIVEFVNAAYPSAESSLSLRWGGVMAKAYSADAQTSAIYSFDLSAPNNSTMYTDAFAMNGTRAGYEPVVAYVKLDLSKLTDIDPSKRVTLNFKYLLSAYDSATTGASSANISLYSANEFDWTNATLSSVRGTAAISTAIDGKTPVAEGSLPVGAGVFGTVDITSFVQSAIEMGNTEQTIAVYVNPIPYTGNNNRLFFRFYHQTGAESAISYFKYTK